MGGSNAVVGRKKYPSPAGYPLFCTPDPEQNAETNSGGE